MAETVEAGGVRIKFEGSTDQLLAEIKKLTGSITDVGNKASAAGAAVTNAGGAMAKSFAAAQARLQAINQAVQSVAGVLGGLNTVEGEVASGAAKIVGALASGGPIDAGIAAIGVGVTHLAKEWKTAKEVAEASLQAMVSGGAEVQAQIAGLMNSAAGLTAGQVKAQEEINFQLLRQGDTQARLAEFDGVRLERLRESINENREFYSDLGRQLDAYDAINAELEETNSSLSNAEGELSRINELQKTIKENAEAEARARAAATRAIDDQYRTLMRVLDGLTTVDSAALARAKTTAQVLAALRGGDGSATAAVERDLDGSPRVDTEDVAEQRRRADIATEQRKHLEEVRAFNNEFSMAMADDAKERERHLRELQATYDEELFARRQANAELAASLTSSVLSGGGGEAIGSLVGGAAGAAIAPLVGVDPMTGGGIGEVLGGLLGGLIDKLPAAIEFVSSIFSALGVLLAPLNAIFQSWLPQTAALSRLFAELVPVITEALAFFVAEGPLWAELIEAMIPLVAIVARLTMVFLTIFPVVKGIVFILEEVTRGLDALGDGIAAALNALNIVGVDTGSISADGDSGASTAAEVNAANDKANQESQDAISAWVGTIMDGTYATEENTKATRAATEQLSNMPKMWKLALGVSQAASADPPSEAPGRAGTGTTSGGGSGHRTTIMLGGKVLADVLEEEDRFSGLKRRGVAKSGGANGPRGDD